MSDPVSNINSTGFTFFEGDIPDSYVTNQDNVNQNLQSTHASHQFTPITQTNSLDSGLTTQNHLMHIFKTCCDKVQGICNNLYNTTKNNTFQLNELSKKINTLEQSILHSGPRSETIHEPNLSTYQVFNTSQSKTDKIGSSSHTIDLDVYSNCPDLLQNNSPNAQANSSTSINVNPIHSQKHTSRQDMHINPTKKKRKINSSNEITTINNINNNSTVSSQQNLAVVEQQPSNLDETFDPNTTKMINFLNRYKSNQISSCDLVIYYFFSNYNISFYELGQKTRDKLATEFTKTLEPLYPEYHHIDLKNETHVKKLITKAFNTENRQIIGRALERIRKYDPSLTEETRKYYGY